MLDYGGEGETVEFKESTGELKEGIKPIASTLNRNKRVAFFDFANKGKTASSDKRQIRIFHHRNGYLKAPKNPIKLYLEAQT